MLRPITTKIHDSAGKNILMPESCKRIRDMDGYCVHCLKVTMSKYVCLVAALSVAVELSAQTSRPSSLLAVDFQKLVSRADLVYDQPVARSEEGMPVGNGSMGTLVWTTRSSLHFQLNRVDVFANNSDSDNFFERHTDYCGGVGFIDIDIADEGHDLFLGDSFRQRLRCYDGIVTTAGGLVEASTFVWQEQDVMAVSITDTRDNKQPVYIHLRPLRAPQVRRGDHLAKSMVKVAGNRIILTQEFREDDYYCASAVVVEVSDRRSIASLESETLARLITGTSEKPTVILAATAASFDPSRDLVAEATKKLDAARVKGVAGMLDANSSWWKEFWEQSFVHLHSADGVAEMVEKHYAYYLYVMASSSRGAYPAKFNGMLWTTGGDERKWGSLFWGANQSCLYNALFQANHPELLMPMFDMYSNAISSFGIAARQQWGSDGIFIPETMAFDGFAPLPEDIAAEMRLLYLGGKNWTDRSKRFESYAWTKMPFQSRWNWKKDVGWKNGQWQYSDKGGGPYGHVTHIFSRAAKVAYQYWLYYEYRVTRRGWGNGRIRCCAVLRSSTEPIPIFKSMPMENITSIT
ncbi:MAG TPA: DUF5703 domain-containing protein [Chryseosolibacter sp.]|nr:DUF5703 domain-containing protein [Chryseosolibacter sp.]